MPLPPQLVAQRFPFFRNIVLPMSPKVSFETINKIESKTKKQDKTILKKHMTGFL